MKRLLACRRTFIAVFGISACLVLGLRNGTDVSNAIAAIAMGLAAANAGESAYKKKDEASNVAPVV